MPILGLLFDQKKIKIDQKGSSDKLAFSSKQKMQLHFIKTDEKNNMRWSSLIIIDCHL